METIKSRRRAQRSIFIGIVVVVLAFLISRSELFSRSNFDYSPATCFFVIKNLNSIGLFNYGQTVVEFDVHILNSTNQSGEWAIDGRKFKYYMIAGSVRPGYYYGELSIDEFGPALGAKLAAAADGTWWNAEEQEWKKSIPSTDFLGSRNE